VATPTIDDIWLIVRALHKDLDRLNERIIHLEESLLPSLRDDILRLPEPEEADPPGWVSPSEERAPRSDRAWRSASGS
jgi:hypothetical protein